MIITGLLFVHFFLFCGTEKISLYPKFHTTFSGVLVSSLEDSSRIKRGYDRRTTNIRTWPCFLEASKALEVSKSCELHTQTWALAIRRNNKKG